MSSKSEKSEFARQLSNLKPVLEDQEEDEEEKEMEVNGLRSEYKK